MGGGLGTDDQHDDETAGGGGGATDVRLVLGKCDDLKSLASRIMVAGGRSEERHTTIKAVQAEV